MFEIDTFPSQDLLTTVRSVEGAYWYLSSKKSSFNMTSSNEFTTSSEEDLMIQNTAIHTLLRSDDNDARLLLGTLDHISDLDISLINTIDDPSA